MPNLFGIVISSKTKKIIILRLSWSWSTSRAMNMVATKSGKEVYWFSLWIPGLPGNLQRRKLTDIIGGYNNEK
jgi:hypothetical protein